MVQINGSTANTFTGGVFLASGYFADRQSRQSQPVGRQPGGFDDGHFPNRRLTGFLQSTVPLTGSATLLNPVAFGSITSTTTTAANLVVQGSNNIQFNGAVTNDDAANTLTVLGNANVTFNGASFGLLGTTNARTFTITGPVNVVIGGAVVNGGGAAGSLTKSGTGMLTLSGGTNGYTGTTTINDGILLSESIGTSGGFISVNALTMGGGTLDLLRFDSSISTQNISTFTLSNNSSSHVIINSALGTVNFNAASFVRNVAGGSTIDFTFPASGTIGLGTRPPISLAGRP